MKKDSFYIYGKKPIEEQLMRNPGNVIRIFVSDVVRGDSQEFASLKTYSKENNIPINAISKHKLKEYVGEVNTQGIIALVKKYEFMSFDEWEETLDLETLPAVLLLDGVEDTHNYGAILRTAAATGISAVMVAKDRQAPVNGTVFKTSAGAALSIPIVQVSNINQTILKLQNMKFWVAAIDMDTEANPSQMDARQSKALFRGRTQPLWDQTFDTPMAFVVGSEGKGVSEKVSEKSDFILSIPMENNIESLNVSVATAVTLYEWKRQKSSS